MKGAIGKADKGVEKAVIDLLMQLLEKKTFDAVLISVRVPAKDSYAYVLVQDPSLFEEATPLPPIMPVQGAKALSKLTRSGTGNMKIAAIMRPCEARATIELDKLEQVELDNITLISMDCPGALPLSGYLANPEASEDTFEKAVKKWDSGPIRDICKMCDNSSMVAGDLHIGTLGAKDGTFFLVVKTQKGEDVLGALGLNPEKALEAWEKKVEEVAAQRKGTREQALEKFGPLPPGMDRLLEVFGDCINCHNCSRVCPICYCQLCYFDSDAVKHPADDQLQRARSSGSLRLPPDTLLFHVGRMLHMGLSCVSCGVCEDACPASIPVAQIFSLASRDTQALFDYLSGRDREEPVPLITYKEDELKELGE